MHSTRIRIALACIAVGTLAACNLLDPNPGPVPLTIVTGGAGPSGNMIADTTIGAHLYAQLCARCHGDSAQGTPQFSRNIQGFAGITPVVRNGSGLMPGFPSLSDSDIRSIELFLAGLRPASTDTMQGAPLYARYCASCHGDSAQGVSGKGIGIRGRTGLDSIIRQGNAQMPKFPWMSHAQVLSIERFLSGFAMPTDGFGLYEFYCSACHGDSAQGTAAKGPGIQQATGIATVVQNGTRLMPPVHQLTAAQIALIEQWLAAVPLPTTGLGLYARFCARCHGASALGDTNITPGLAGNAIGNGEMWNAVQSGSDAGRLSGHVPMVAIPQLTQAQSNLIGQWLSTASYPRTGRMIYTINCYWCHGPRGSEMESSSMASLQRVLQDGKNDDGRRVMPAYPFMPPVDVDSLYQYLQTLTGGRHGG